VATPILMYHRVADDGPEGLVRWRISPPEFERQLKWLAAEGYTSARLDEWPAIQAGDVKARERRIVLTFDDAYTDFITTALPLLQRYGFGATMFVPTGFIGGTADWDRWFGAPAPLMSWQQVDAIAKAGIEMGAHTVSHPRLSGFTDTQAIADEMARSRDILQARYGHAIPTFAYPYGAFDDRVVKAAEDVGFTLAVTTVPQTTGLLTLGRIGVFGDEPFEAFIGKIRDR
jgi:peptidoglycan/xylan/chitin deacetylase (PgdA/CDA1 family)